MRITLKYIILLILSIFLLVGCSPPEGSKIYRITYKLHYPDTSCTINIDFKADDLECYMYSSRGSNTIMCKEKAILLTWFRYRYDTTCPIEFISLKELKHENNYRH